MWKILISIPIVWIIGLAFGYFLHKYLHSLKSGKFGKMHKTHHRLYPITDFTSKKYREAGADNGNYIFIIAAIPIAVIPILLSIVGIFPLYLTTSIILEMALIGYLNVYVHDTFHVQNHIFNRIPLFKIYYRGLIKAHLMHHKNVKSNFGIYSFEFDRLFGTYRKNNKKI